MGIFDRLKSFTLREAQISNKIIKEKYGITISEEIVKDITNDSIKHYSNITHRNIIEYINSKGISAPYIFQAKREIFFNVIFPILKRMYPGQHEMGYGLYDYKNKIIWVYTDVDSEALNVAVHELDHYMRDISGLEYHGFLAELSAHIVQFISKYGNLNEAIYYTIQTLKSNYSIDPDLDLDKLTDSFLFLSKEGILFKIISSTNSLEEIMSFSKNSIAHTTKISHEGKESSKQSVDEADKVLRILERNGISNTESFREELIRIYENAFLRNGEYMVILTGKGRKVLNLIILKNIEELYVLEHKQTEDFNIIAKLDIKSSAPTRPVLYR